MRAVVFRAVWLMLAAAAASPAQAQAQAPAAAAPLTLPSNFQVAGPLRVGLFLTTHLAGFQEALRQGKGDQAQLTTQKVKIGQSIHALMLFTGCKVSVTHTCTMSAVFHIRPPKGNPVQSDRVYMWRGQAPAANAIHQGENPFTITLDASDPPGEYHAEAEITDHNANLVVKVKTTFTATR